jgi:hypothetical protein
MQTALRSDTKRQREPHLFHKYDDIKHRCILQCDKYYFIPVIDSRSRSVSASRYETKRKQDRRRWYKLLVVTFFVKATMYVVVSGVT